MILNKTSQGWRLEWMKKYTEAQETSTMDGEHKDAQIFPLPHLLSYSSQSALAHIMQPINN